jgi:hypothetical protein
MRFFHSDVFQHSLQSSRNTQEPRHTFTERFAVSSSLGPAPPPFYFAAVDDVNLLWNGGVEAVYC